MNHLSHNLAGIDFTFTLEDAIFLPTLKKPLKRQLWALLLVKSVALHKPLVRRLLMYLKKRVPVIFLIQRLLLFIHLNFVVTFLIRLSIRRRFTNFSLLSSKMIHQTPPHGLFTLSIRIHQTNPHDLTPLLLEVIFKSIPIMAKSNTCQS